MRVSPAKGMAHAVSFFGSVALVVLVLVLSVACDDANVPRKVRLDSRQTLSDSAPQPADESLRFGFDLRLSPKEDVKIYLPFLQYLTRATGRRFTIVFSDNYEDTARHLGTGITHFAALGPVNCLRANRTYGTVCLAVGKNQEGRPEYQSAIVAAPDSPIRSLAELRGKSFAFGNLYSTQGYLIPRNMLEENGVMLAALRHHVFAGSHANVARLVLNGEYDAGAMQDNLARHLADEGKLRIVAISRPYPASLICASAKVDPLLREKVRQALLAFEPRGMHAGALVNWEQSEMPAGFAPYEPASFRQLNTLAERYGIVP